LSVAAAPISRTYSIDDIILTASSSKLLQHTTIAPQQQFATKDLGPLHHLLGVPMEQQVNDLFLH
jgi:hypothetical protein